MFLLKNIAHKAPKNRLTLYRKGLMWYVKLCNKYQCGQHYEHRTLDPQGSQQTFGRGPESSTCKISEAQSRCWRVLPPRTGTLLGTYFPISISIGPSGKISQRPHWVLGFKDWAQSYAPFMHLSTVQYLRKCSRIQLITWMRKFHFYLLKFSGEI